MRKIYDCDPGCPVQNTMMFLAGKWKCVILYHLFQEEVLRFSELQRKLPYVNKRMLAKQLLELEKDEIIAKKVYPVYPLKTEYSVTDFGATFYPIIHEMMNWGEKYLDAVR
ncbi:helix-turn-helix transcriptional regulator [Bombilactobacillus folatiphilus]|uniref:Helix-turn-helix transcriptional regulator n=1 Tax=Bombilactobacillus folatiphilus TaxID=2923362 RepID=A0ABY4P8W8_9LACO|nr:helix-turn-helix domain-containing protein [Bombilactobacillus folatiphilus]UQS82174.1 helix-turn-helix transcriptional regulator [Bombilactobacillus folatiphilus]